MSSVCNTLENFHRTLAWKTKFFSSLAVNPPPPPPTFFFCLFSRVTSNHFGTQKTLHNASYLYSCSCWRFLFLPPFFFFFFFLLLWSFFKAALSSKAAWCFFKIKILPFLRIHRGHKYLYVNFAFVVDDCFYVLYSRKFSSGIYFRRFRQTNSLTKLNSWLKFFSKPKVWTTNILECEEKRKAKERLPNDRRANERRPTLDENKFLTNCPTVTFNEFFSLTKIPCYTVDQVLIFEFFFFFFFFFLEYSAFGFFPKLCLILENWYLVRLSSKFQERPSS